MNKGNLLRSLFLKALFPNILAVLGGTVNVLIDGVLVGQKLGDVGITVINQSLVVYLLLCTVGSLIASGCVFRSATALGLNQPDMAEKYYGYALTYGIAFSAVLTVVLLVFLSPLCRLLSTPDTYDGLRQYLFATITGGGFKVMLYIPFFYLKLDGKPDKAAVTMVVMMISNAVLDAVALYLLDGGIAGAGWASVIATVIACIFGYGFLHAKGGIFRFCPLLPPKGDLFSMAKHGAPMAFNNILSAGRLLVLNLIFNRLGLMVVFAVTNSLNEFLFCLQQGVPQTASPMLGVLGGERDNKGMRELFRVQAKAGLILASIAAVVIIVMYRAIPALYGSSETDLFAFICYAASFVIGMFNSILFFYYSTVGRSVFADTVVLCRVFLLAVAPALPLSLFGEWIWLFYPLSEAATLFVIYLMVKAANRKNHTEGWLMLDRTVEENGKSVSFEVACNKDAICEVSHTITPFCEDNGFSPKKTMAVSLAIEEILGIITEKSLTEKDSMDLRVLVHRDDCIIRVRAGGKRYNPVAMNDDSLDYLGVTLITKMSKKIDYQTTLGVNTLIITI